MSIQLYDVEARRKQKMKSDDRLIILKPIDGKKTLSSTGMPDKRLFTGENKLHAVLDLRTGMWHLHYEIGALPGGLKGNWTLFSELEKHVRAYFKSRNVEVTEIKE